MFDNRLLRWALSGLLAFCSLTLLSTTSGAQQKQYFIQGRPVSEAAYQAALLVQEGMQQMRANNNQVAYEKFKTAVDMAPELPEAQVNLGVVLAKLGRTQEAIAPLKRVTEIKPDLAEAWINLAALYQTTGRVNEAISCYNEFLKRFPKHKDAGKVQALIRGLEGVAQHSKQAQHAEDYLAEVTRNGANRWPLERIPLKVFVHDGEQVPEYKATYRPILMEAFADWAKASGGVLGFQFVQRPEQADIECLWLADPKQLNNPAEAGETNLSFKGKMVNKGTIKLLTVPLTPEVPLTNNRFRVICLHEIGHALGLSGHSFNPQDVMFYSASLSDEWKNLSDRDARTIVKLYSSTP